MNNLCADIGYRSIYHDGEELCGDHIDVIEQDDGSTVVVLADGLGSGVKASKLLIALRAVKGFFGSFYMKIVYILIALVIVIFILMIIRLNIARIRKRKVKYIPYGKKKGDDRYDR